MQCDWNVPDGISLRNCTTCVWVDTLAYRIAVCDRILQYSLGIGYVMVPGP